MPSIRVHEIPHRHELVGTHYSLLSHCDWQGKETMPTMSDTPCWLVLNACNKDNKTHREQFMQSKCKLHSFYISVYFHLSHLFYWLCSVMNRSWHADVTMAMRGMNSWKSIFWSPFWSRSENSKSRVSLSLISCGSRKQVQTLSL